jgi:hypothetical protein
MINRLNDWRYFIYRRLLSVNNKVINHPIIHVLPSVDGNTLEKWISRTLA